MCDVCGFSNIADEIPLPFEESEFSSLINDVWNGIVTKYSLPVSFYVKTISNLNKGVNRGFGKDIFEVEFGSPDYEMLKDLTDNIQVFSGAKTYQQVRSLTDLLKEQKLKSNFYAFKEKAMPILGEYNTNYLKAEYNTAIGSSRMAGNWMRIEKDKDVLSLLQYQTVGDARVRPEHAQLDNIVRPVGDKFWDTLYPPNGWNCRCMVIQLSEGETTDLRGRNNLYDNVPKEFRFNCGKDKIIFKEKGQGKHPYFTVAKGDKEFAKRNFDLPIIAPPKK